MRLTLVFSAILLCVAQNVYGSRPSSYDNYGLPVVSQRAPSRNVVQRPQQSRNVMQNNYGASNLNQQGYGMEDTRMMLTDGIVTSDGQCRCDCRGANGGASYFNQFQNQRYENNNMNSRLPSSGQSQLGRINDGGRMNDVGRMNQQSMTSQSMNQQAYDSRMEHPMSRVNSHNNGFAGYDEQTNSFGSSGFSSESFSNDGWGDSSDDMYGQIDEDANYHKIQSSSSSSSSMYQQDEGNDDEPIFPNVELPTVGSAPQSLDPERKIAKQDPEASKSLVDKILSRNGYNSDNMAIQSSSGSSMDDSSRRNRITSSSSSSSNRYNPGQSSSSSSYSTSSGNNQNMKGQSNYQSTSFGSGFGDEDVLSLEVYPDPNSLADKIRMANEANGKRVVFNGLIGGPDRTAQATPYQPKDDGMSVAEKIAASYKGSQPKVSPAPRTRPSNMNSQSSGYSSNDLASSIANSAGSKLNSQPSGYSSNDLGSRSNIHSSNTVTSSTSSSSTSSNSNSGSGSGMLVDDDSLMLPSIGSPSALLSKRNDRLPSPNDQ
ncbi:uncharacterized protein LOC141853758 isoform X2 [Brevipalpus obovatus]|uniref:uncharacterized protein LOC141853758 isoform X2 n=1 Tax=Brevipalpus obovatus TaxID=246614 RepID=UPI003D9EFD2C